VYLTTDYRERAYGDYVVNSKLDITDVLAAFLSSTDGQQFAAMISAASAGVQPEGNGND
jgi:hypothetical protein